MKAMMWIFFVSALLTGCGSGGAAGSGVGPSAGPGSATVQIGTQASSAATVVYAVEFVLHLPDGVSLPADPASGVLLPGVLQVADGGAFAGGRLLPATTGVQASVLVNISDSGGFAVGDLAVLNCTVAPGTTAEAAGFSLDGFSARDENGTPIPGITPHITLLPQ